MPKRMRTKGRIYYIVGPSGSGKDALITVLRNTFVDDLVVAHRYITRDANAGGENHIALSRNEFLTRNSHNMFAMSWEAHGLHYGIGQEIHQWLNAGLDVLVNGSRAYLAVAKSRFSEQLVPIAVNVELQVLEQRLRARGRENSAEIAQRLERAQAFKIESDSFYLIDNSGTLQNSVEQFSCIKQSLEQREAVGDEA